MKRALLRVGLLGALALACSAGRAAGFEFWYAHTGPIAAAIVSLCDGFNRSQQDHQVRCISPGTYEQTMQKTIAAYRAGKQPAVVEIYDVGTLDMMLSGAVYPVFRLMKETGHGIDWRDYIGAVRSYYATSAGDLYSLPFNVSTAVLYTNTAKLAAAGVDAAPQTWEAFEAAAEKLKAAGEKCPALSDYNPWIMLEQISAVEGVPLATKNNGRQGLAAEYVFNTGVHLRFMQDLMRWRSKHLLIDAAATRAGSQSLAFANGECAMVIDATSAWSVIKTSRIGHIGVHAIPVYAGTTRRNSVPGGASLWVMQGYDAPVYAAVAAFFSYLQQASNQIAFAEQTGYVPVTRSAGREMKQSRRMNDLAPAMAGIDSLSLPGNAYSQGARLGFALQFRHVWTEEIQKVFAARQSVPHGLDRAKQRGDILLKRFEETYAGQQLP